jgi:hypothetical protein
METLGVWNRLVPRVGASDRRGARSFGAKKEPERRLRLFNQTFKSGMFRLRPAYGDEPMLPFSRTIPHSSVRLS